MAQTQLFGPFTLGPGVNWYYWFNFNTVPFGGDNRIVYMIARPGIDSEGIVSKQMWVRLPRDINNPAPPYYRYGLLVGNDSNRTSSFFLAVQYFG